ncbi:MAG: DUF1015 family protein [Rhodothermaceae bacterium]
MEKEEDRTNHIIRTKAQTGPAYLTYPKRALIDSTVEEIKTGKPLFNFTDEEDVKHIVWEVPENLNETLIDEFSKLKHLYIADGHHRSASAANVRKKLDLPKDHPGNYFLGVAFPENQLDLGSCNRLILSGNGIKPIDFINGLSENFNVEILVEPNIRGIKIYMDSC